MITIVEPKEHIAKLWGKQKVRESDTYRLMRYVLRVDHEGKVLLHNVVTGQLVVLSEEEARALDQLPTAYTPTMEQLVTEHYLVPEDFDEHQQVVNLRNILWKMYDAQRSKVLKYCTILPTTACNARCYYCFEQGCESVTMTEATANDVVEYIAKNCGEDRFIEIEWFGGEPTVASHRIDQICKGLRAKGITYQSDITTNGYLFDEDMVRRAKELWNVERVMISVDGTEEKYNKVKAYVNVKDNPYQRVMRNIGLLLAEGIYVVFRVNYDVNNYDELPVLFKELEERFKSSPFLSFFAQPIVGEYVDPDGKVSHGSEDWFMGKNLEIHSFIAHHNKSGIEGRLPFLTYKGCQAASDNSVTITPQGWLVRCPEQFGVDQVTGNITDGITNFDLVNAWKCFGNSKKCEKCIFFPFCLKMEKCSTKERCTRFSVALQSVKILIQQRYSKYSLEC